MFLLATLNPASRRTKRRRARHKTGCACVICGHRAKRTRGRGRRRLSAWQRMVKKHGGVMQALAVRRRGGKVSRKSRRSSTKRGTSLRRRPRRSKKEVKTMARTARRRRRRTPPRGRGGRFMSRRRRAGGRRRRRVAANTWFGQPRRHRKAARLGYRRRRRHSFADNPPRRRRGRRHYRRNSVVPVSWNPRRRRRRGYRRNAVLPYFAMNPAKALGLGGAPGAILGRVQSFLGIGFWTETALPATAGFLGTKVVGKAISTFLGGILKTDEASMAGKAVKIGSQALAASALSFLVSRFLGQKRGQAVFIGGVVSVAHAVLMEIIPAGDFRHAIGLDGLGDDLSSRMREAVQRRVEAELSGMGTYMTQPDTMRRLDGMGAYVTDNEVRRQAEYSALPTGDLRDYDVSRSETTL